MIKNILFIIHFLTIISCAKAINLEKNIWQDFEGTIGSATIQMSIFINNDGK